MITEVQTSKGTPAITSDKWYLVHSRWVTASGKGSFVRSVDSEHEDSGACRKAARKLRQKLANEGAELPEAERDEVFVRRPNYKTLKRAKARREQSG
jgi:hypothetical protein